MATVIADPTRLRRLALLLAEIVARTAPAGESAESDLR